MPCPVCGGIEREPIAPGYWQCRSSVTRYGTQRVPDPAAPPWLGITVLQTVSWQETCTNTYQEEDGDDGPGAVCGFCTTFAIGLCGECGKAVCGLHSTMFETRRVCLSDRDE